MRAALVALGVATIAVGAGGVAVAASSTPTAMCTKNPVISETTSNYKITVVCTMPKPPVATVTVTATPKPEPTVTADPTPTDPPAASKPAEPTTPPAAPTSSPTAATGGFPDASNTGPSGTLTAYTGPMTITAAGTVIDSKTITGDLTIKAAGVVVKNSRINGTIATDENSTGYSFTISDSYVDAGARGATGVGAVNFTMVRTEVVGGNRSVNCWKACDVRDSYVHGQFRDSTGTFHESGLRMGANNKIVHNTIVCDAPDVPPDAGCSADLTGYGDFAAVTNVLVQDNLFGASTGGYCAYGGSSAGKPYSNGANNVDFIDNTFAKSNRNDHGRPDCAYYGAMTAFNPNAPGSTFTGNTYTDGTPVTY